MDVVALLHQCPRAEETLVHSARDAEAFLLLGAEPATLGRCVLVGEMGAREDFDAGEAGESFFFLVSREGLRLDEELSHLWAQGCVVRVDQPVKASAGL